jgi:hypothetical protein
LFFVNVMSYSIALRVMLYTIFYYFFKKVKVDVAIKIFYFIRWKFWKIEKLLWFVTITFTIISLQTWIIIIREKYILAPQTTTLSLDSTLNYQHLHSDPPNYHFMIFWPHPSIYTVNSNRIWPKTRKYHSLNRENFKV